jgi:hypothetical protein
MKLFETRYRIVTNKDFFFVTQFKQWWWPFWLNLNSAGEWICFAPAVLHASAYDAMRPIRRHIGTESGRCK